MPEMYIKNHFHSTTACTFDDCTVVVTAFPADFEEAAKAANLALICESAGVSPETATRLGYGL